MNLAIRIATGLLVAAVLAPSARADVELTPQERDNLGIQTETARPVQTGRHWSAPAQVLDPAPLIAALGELHTAEAAAAASRAEAERSRQLYETDTNVARKALDAARAQASADEARVNAARAQLLGTWGQRIGALPGDQREALVRELLAGKVSLVRADLTEPLPPRLDPRVELRRLNGKTYESATWLGTLPQSASLTLAGSALLQLAAPLPAGTLLEAVLIEPTPSIKGVGVPGGAVIRWHGAEWIYEEVSANHFERRGVQRGLRVEGRALLADTPTSVPKVVTVGARSLLAAELGASGGGAEEGEGD